jgi:hypothetical protein
MSLERGGAWRRFTFPPTVIARDASRDPPHAPELPSVEREVLGHSSSDGERGSAGYYYGGVIGTASDAVLGRVVAHETAHFLGLQHVVNRGVSGQAFVLSRSPLLLTH